MKPYFLACPKSAHRSLFQNIETAETVSAVGATVAGAVVAGGTGEA